MSPELEKKLHESYPTIFPAPENPDEYTSGWSIETDDGWYDIIDAMCDAMTHLNPTRMEINEPLAKALGIEPHGNNESSSLTYYLVVQPPKVIARQVKEKFGTLRFYYNLEFEPHFEEQAYGEHAIPEARLIANRYHSFVAGIVCLGKILSSRTCEITGKEGELHGSNGGKGWLKTLNREIAKTAELHSRRDYFPLADLPPSEETSSRMRFR